MVSMPSESGNHVEQQQIPCRVVAGKLVGLNRRTNGDDFVGFRLFSGSRPKKSATAR
jgi:hypothetical protein